MTAGLCGPKVLCVVASFHMVVGDLHVDLVPYLSTEFLVRSDLMEQLRTLSSLQLAALRVTRVILQGWELICSTNKVSLAARFFQYSISTCRE